MIFDQMIGDKRPLSWALQFWPVVVSAFACSLAATWFCKRFAVKFGIIDKPDNLVKTHKEPVAYLGGIGILFGLGAGIIAGLYLMQGQESFGVAFKWLVGIMAGGTIACFIGVIDDILDIRPIQKILGHASPVQTQRYSHLSGSVLQDAANSINGYLDKATNQNVGNDN